MLLRFPGGEVVEVASPPIADVRDGEMVWLIEGSAYYTKRGCSGMVKTRSVYVVPHDVLGVPGGVEPVGLED